MCVLSADSPLSKDPTVSWSSMMTFVPAVSVLFSNICLILVYNFCQKTGTMSQQDYFFNTCKKSIRKKQF